MCRSTIGITESESQDRKHHGDNIRIITSRLEFFENCAHNRREPKTSRQFEQLILLF